MDLASSSDAATLAHRVFSRRDGWTSAHVLRRTEQVRALPARMVGELDGWLESATAVTPMFLDLGCGSGGLLAAAAHRGRLGIGIDVSLEWLVVARQLILEHGGSPMLAAAMAEALPLSDDSVGGVVSLDVIEHVGSRESYAREIDRVLKRGHVCAIATPNRFSLTAEPHVSVWGVGWVPRVWQRQYVWWRSGKSYDYCSLSSVREIRYLFRTCTSMEPCIYPGSVPKDELELFPPVKRFFAITYNRLIAMTPVRAAVLPFCPFFRIISTKPLA